MRREKLEDISVQKITETANITRGTFYLHNKDKFEWYHKRPFMVPFHFPAFSKWGPERLESL